MILKTLNWKIAVFSLILIIGLLNIPALAQENQPEKIKAVKTITGEFTWLVVGDYVHAGIKTTSGKIKYFWIGSYVAQYFMVANRHKTMTITYEVVDAYIHEEGGRMIIERIKSARIGKLTSDRWWENLTKKQSEEKLMKKYELLSNKYTKN